MRLVAIAFVALLLNVLVGCGGGGGPSGPGGPPGNTIASGPVSAQAAPGDRIQSVPIGASAASRYAFVGIADGGIIQLGFYPSPGRLVGRGAGPGGATKLVFSQTNGAGLTSASVGMAVFAPRWSPDGLHVAWTWGYGLAICDPDGSNVVLLPLKPPLLLVSSPVAWGPDNQTLYFVATSSEPGAAPLIRRLNYVTGDLSAPYPLGGAKYQALDCRPDGRYLAVQRGMGIDCIDTVTGREHPIWRVTPPAGTALARPRWSPDGRHIAYERVNAGGAESDVCLFDTSTYTSRDLVTGSTDDKYPDWTPDGQYVLLCRAAALYRVPVGGGTPELLAKSWGLQPDSWAPSHDRWRTLIGDPGGDWGGADPPFADMQQAAILALSGESLATAVAFSSASVGDPLSVTDQTPGTGTTAIVAEVSGTEVGTVCRDEGAGMPPTTWQLGNSRTGYPSEVLAVFSAESAQLTSVIPVWRGVTADSAAALGPRIEQNGASLAITGAQMQVYDARGTLLSGAAPIGRVSLEGRTGRFLSP